MNYILFDCFESEEIRKPKTEPSNFGDREGLRGLIDHSYFPINYFVRILCLPPDYDNTCFYKNRPPLFSHSFLPSFPPSFPRAFVLAGPLSPPSRNSSLGVGDRADVNVGVKDLIEGLLEKEPSQRYVRLLISTTSLLLYDTRCCIRFLLRNELP